GARGVNSCGSAGGRQFSIQDRHFQHDQGPMAVAALHRELTFLAKQYMQALRYVDHANPASGAHLVSGNRWRRAHPHAVIFHLDHQLMVLNSAADGNASAIHFGRKAVLDAVFHQRLQQDGGNYDVQRFRIKILIDAKLVAAKAHDLDIQIIVNEFNFFAQLHKLIMLAQQPAQDFGKLQNQFAGAVGIKAHQGGDRVECVEQEMWINLALQGVQSGFQKQALLLFQLHLNACEVPDLNGDGNRGNRGGKACQQRDWSIDRKRLEPLG